MATKGFQITSLLIFLATGNVVFNAVVVFVAFVPTTVAANGVVAEFAANVDNFTINYVGGVDNISGSTIASNMNFSGNVTPASDSSSKNNKYNYNSNSNNKNANNNASSGEASKLEGRKLRRGKRYLDFLKGSRVSWRTTVKNNILKINTLWGYGFGFRANFPFPDKKDRLRPFFKRDLLHATVDMLDGHGLDGRACILKSYCTAMLDGDTPIGGGMIFKFLQMLFSLNSQEKRHFPYLHPDNCRQILHSHCPLSFNGISPFTDDI